MDRDRDTIRRANQLLQELGEQLEPGRGDVARAYSKAQNSFASPGGPAEAMGALAVELRAAAAVAELLADLTRR